MTANSAHRAGANGVGSGWATQGGPGVAARIPTTRRWRPLAVGAVAASTALLGMASAGAAQAAPAAACTPNVGGTGLSAAVVAHSHQKIVHRTIRANRCDIGIYVGAGVSWVGIDDVTVTGAHFQGIFAEKTSRLAIENSTIRNNGFKTIDPSAPVLPSGVHSWVSQSFAISLFGVSDSSVRGNRVSENGRGGIGIMDNGPNDPGAITQNASVPLVSSTRDSVIGNTMSANYNGCALVAATQNVGGSLSDLILSGNTVRGTGIIPAKGADVGGIVVAADLPGSTVTNAIVNRNTVRNSIEGGVIVNAEAPTSSTKNVWVTSNTLVGNNIGHAEAPNTAGIIVNAAAPGASNLSTVVVHNTVTKQFYGIWSMGSNAPFTFGNHIKVTAGGTPIYHG